MQAGQARAERYRAEAQRLRDEAKLPSNVAVREQMLNIAAQYDRLADSVDLLSRPSKPLDAGSD